MEAKEVVTMFLQAFLALALPAIVVPLGKYLLAQAALLWAQVESERPELAYELKRFAHFAVLAAEQAKAAGYIEDKRKEAFAIIEKLLVQQGYPVDIDLIYAAIEEAVAEEFNREKLAKSTK